MLRLISILFLTVQVSILIGCGDSHKFNDGRGDSYEHFYKKLLEHRDAKVNIELVDSSGLILSFLGETNKDTLVKFLYDIKAKMRFYITYNIYQRKPAYIARFNNEKIEYEIGFPLFTYVKSGCIQDVVCLYIHAPFLQGYISNIQIFEVEGNEFKSLTSKVPVHNFITFLELNRKDFYQNQSLCIILNRKSEGHHIGYSTSDTLHFSLDTISQNKLIFCERKERNW